ncbi:glycosyltransferase family 52 [Lachnospiraceae bacterium JLR.KK008]
MKKRIYVCHTFYNVYVSLLKEWNLPQEEQGQADIALSTMSTDFSGLKERLEASGVFGSVFLLDEKRDSHFPELAKYKKSYHNIVRHLYNRIVYTKKLARLEEPYMTIDFRQYQDIYVYCDSDPIGYYLNYKHIYYHAMEDGLDCLKYLDGAHYDNRGHFKLKAFLASKNVIFIQNGYGKYCLDMEINDLSCLRHRCPKYKVVPRKPLELGLTSGQKRTMLRIFMEDAGGFLRELGEKASGDCILFLTQPHPKSEEARVHICHDIIRDYCQGCHVVIKPHPRDLIDYGKLRPDCTVIKGRFPVEVLNFVEGVHFRKVISIATTALDTIDFADEKINLGDTFWDKYEDPENHNWRTV